MSKPPTHPLETELSESWHRHSLDYMRDMLASEHRNLQPAQLVEITTKYVEYLNALARVEGEYLRVAATLHRWPGMMGKEPEHDDAGTRKFVREHLEKPRIRPASKNADVAEWAQAPAKEIAEMLNKTGPIEKGNPCGIIWAAMSFVTEEVAADGSHFPHCSSSKPMKAAEMIPAIAEKGQQIWAQRDDILLISDVVTCLYGPDTYGIDVYSRRMMDFIQMLAPELDDSRNMLQEQIRDEVKRACASTSKCFVFRVPGLPIRLRKAVNAVWLYAPLRRASVEVKGTGKGKGRHYDFPTLGLKGKRWNEDVRIPLVKAVLRNIPQQCSISRKAGAWVNTSKLTSKDMNPPGCGGPKPGRPKKS